MSIIENFITNKIYDVLYLDILPKSLWASIVELWDIGGSAVPAALVLFFIMSIIILIPLIPFAVIGYFIYKLLKHFELI